MEPFIGQIQPFGFSFAPRGWSKCDGQLLSIAPNTALFALIGSKFGGDGRTSFALPDLRGRSIVHIGSAPEISNILWGGSGGRELVELAQINMPNHAHALTNSIAQVKIYTTDNIDVSAESDSGANGLGTSGTMPDVFRENPATTDHLAGVSISGSTNITGASQAFDIRNPYLGVNVCIALTGIFPSRN